MLGNLPQDCFFGKTAKPPQLRLEDMASTNCQTCSTLFQKNNHTKCQIAKQF